MDYFELIGLMREPFSMAPNPAFFYKSKGHGECLDNLEISLRLKRGLNIVTGEVGTGKTILSRLLLGRFVEFGVSHKFFLILDPTWKTTQEFLIYLHQLFGIPVKEKYQTALMDNIEHFLMDQSLNEKQQIVLMIDEGQKMGPDQIEIIRTLLNFETNDQKLIQVIIFAQPEIQTLIDIHENFKDRIAYRGNLRPMDDGDTVRFIDHRLKVSGLKKANKLMTENAKKLIYRETNGYPRRIIVMAHNLLIEMIKLNQPQINTSIVMDWMHNQELNFA